jgi:hypothetical protein
MGHGERPSPVLVSTPCHQIHGFVDAVTGWDPGSSQVVQAPQDVVPQPSLQTRGPFHRDGPFAMPSSIGDGDPTNAARAHGLMEGDLVGAV